MEESIPKWEQAIIDLLKCVPWVGRPLAWIMRYFGLRVFVPFLLGGLVVLFLVSIGWWPKWLVSEKFKIVEPLNKVSPRQKPKGIEYTHKVIPYKDQEHWLHDHIYYLEKEGDREKQANRIADYIIVVLDSANLPTTTEFVWVLKASPDFTISGQAYKRTIRDLFKLFGLLEARKTYTPADSLYFTVPPCEEGDSLLAILRVSGKKGMVPQDLDRILRSTVE